VQRLFRYGLEQQHKNNAVNMAVMWKQRGMSSLAVCAQRIPQKSHSDKATQNINVNISIQCWATIAATFYKWWPQLINGGQEIISGGHEIISGGHKIISGSHNLISGGHD